MKKVIVVSKTHLDLGFTDYAENIRLRYLEQFIPNAINVAKQLNTEKKRFVWTTGSWLLKEAILYGTEENRKSLREAIKNGDIAPHGMPFTTHTELLDSDTLEYGLEIVDLIDAISGRKTVACKMTDVPGHTLGMLPFLARRGIKLLHIGVNGASALPDVPPCFVWKHGENQVIVIYSGDYGGEFRSELIDDILYFDHTLDNHGANDAESVLKNFNEIEKRYPGYEVTAGRLDDYAELIWRAKDRLPIIENEIGDSWIHGSAADPYKSAALRVLMDLKAKWLEDGSLARGGMEYKGLADNLLCVAEHTCGMDMKSFLADYENYLRRDFDRAREEDSAGVYRIIEKSWTEQRGYINKAVSALSSEHKKTAKSKLAKLIPDKFFVINGEPLKIDINTEVSFENSTIELNSYGGIKKLALSGRDLIEDNNKPALQYHSYGVADYDFWLSNYSRDLDRHAAWAFSDFARPGLERIDEKYRQGRFSYTPESITAARALGCVKIDVRLRIDEYCHDELGAAGKAQLLYTLEKDRVKIEIIWLDKPANRLTESTVFRMYPGCGADDLRYIKIDSKINPLSVVRNGSRNLSAVRGVRFKVDGAEYTINNLHAPLAGLGEGKILKFDNHFEDVKADGIAFILHDNVWGTNFPLWYEDNAYFCFEITKQGTD